MYPHASSITKIIINQLMLYDQLKNYVAVPVYKTELTDTDILLGNL
jgi:hypothetical protein